MRERIKKILPIAMKRSDVGKFLRQTLAHLSDPVVVFENRLRALTFERGMTWSRWRRLKVDVNDEARATFFEVLQEAKYGLRWRRDRFTVMWSESFPPTSPRRKFRPHIIGGGQTRLPGSRRS